MMNRKKILGLAVSMILSAPWGFTQSSPVKKVKDMIIYQDSLFYSSFPSVVKTKNNDYLLAFRRAPERRAFGERHTVHVDPNSYLVKMESKDGKNWSENPELIYAHPFGGSQDPCLLTLRDGTILCASYGWSFLREDGLKNLKEPYFQSGDGTFLGGYMVRSTDHGKTWSDPIYPPAIKQEVNNDMYGNKVPVYNRGAMYESKSGRIFWVVAATDNAENKKTSNYLMYSDDKGKTWNYMSVVAEDPEVAFNETSIYETPKGDLVAFLRTARYEDQACIARSKDGGKTFEWESMGFKGHPLQAMRLPDDRVFLVYGYRHEPFGIRAKILNAECTDFATAEEIVIRDDGDGWDIGYPWAVMLDDHQILVTYYFNLEDGPRHIAGTILELTP